MSSMAATLESDEQGAAQGETLSMETWDPMADAFHDPAFNTYTSGPGANIESALQPCNRRAAEKERLFRLYVTGLPQGLSKRGLTNVFYNFGVPLDVTICRNAGTGYQFAFVSYRTEKEAEKAIRELHQKPPIRLRVEFARSDDDKAKKLEEEARAELLLKIMEDMGQYKSPSYTPKFPHRMNVVMPGAHGMRADHLADQAWCDTGVPREAGFYRPYAGDQMSNSSRVVLSYLAPAPETKTDRVVVLGRGYSRISSKCPAELPGRAHKFTKLDGEKDVWVCGREVALKMGRCARCAVQTPSHCKRCGMWYCSRGCQLDDWPRHKGRCRQVSALVSSNEDNGPNKKVGPIFGGRGRGRVSSSLMQMLMATSPAVHDQQPPAEPASALEALLQPSCGADQFLPVSELSIAFKLSRGATGSGGMHQSYGEEFTAVLDCSPEDAAAIAHIHEDLMLDDGPDPFRPGVGDLVAAVSSASGLWSRGRVLEVLKSGFVVALCDLGLVERASEVRRLPDKYKCLPEHVVTAHAPGRPPLSLKKGAVFSYEVLSHEGSEASCRLTLADSTETLEATMVPWQPLPEDAGLRTVPLSVGEPVVVSSFFDQGHLYLRPATKHHLLQYHIVLSATAAYAAIHGREIAPRRPRLGEIVACQFSGDGVFYRALVVAVDGDSFTVAYVDFGNQEAVSLDKMRTLNSPLKQHPCYAVKVHLRDAPKTPLTPAAAEYLTVLVREEAVLRLAELEESAHGVKLWRDKVCVNEVVTEKLQPEWRKQLATNVPPASCGPSKLKYVTLPVGGTVSLVVLSVLEEDDEAPAKDLTVVGCRADEEVIPYVYRTLLREINLYVYHCKAKMFVPHEGEACVAKNTDDVWHRALCVKLKRDELVVMLVDVGTLIKIPYHHVRSIVPEFTHVPALGLLCRFQDVSEAARKSLTPHSVHTVRVVSHAEDEYLLEMVDTGIY